MLAVLDSTTKSLVVYLSSAASTDEPELVCNFADRTTTPTLTPGSTAVETTGTTEKEIAAAPAASTARMVRNCQIVNKDSIAHTFNFRLKDSAGTDRDIACVTIAAGACSQIPSESASGASASESIKETITQAGHGFAAEDNIYHNGTIWTKSQANSAANAEVIAKVESVSGDDFTMVLHGKCDVTGGTAGENGFLSAATAGATITDASVLVAGEIRKPIGQWQSATVFWVNIQLGFEITDEATVSNLFNGRLTLESGVAVSTSDQSAKVTVYLTPFLGNRIATYNGSNWVVSALTEISKGTSGLVANTNYDVFVYDNAGTLTLELTAWSTDTARVTLLTTQDGVLVKTGDATRRYAGTIRTTSATEFEDSASRRLVWNYYNRVNKIQTASESTASWTYTTATFREVNAGTTPGTSRVEILIGVSEDAVQASVRSTSQNSAGDWQSIGIGISSNTNVSLTNAGHASANVVVATAEYIGYPGEGFYTVRWLEYSGAAGTTTWYGLNSGGNVKSGLTVISKG